MGYIEHVTHEICHITYERKKVCIMLGEVDVAIEQDIFGGKLFFCRYLSVMNINLLLP